MAKRPGLFIKQYLLDNDSASISEIHQAYRADIKAENARRDRTNLLRAPTYNSFYQYFRHFVVLELVERVGEEPTEMIENPEEMGFVEKSGGKLKVHTGAVRRLWKLTAAGRADDTSWDNPMKARGYQTSVQDI